MGLDDDIGDDDSDVDSRKLEVDGNDEEKGPFADDFTDDDSFIVDDNNHAKLDQRRDPSDLEKDEETSEDSDYVEQADQTNDVSGSASEEEDDNISCRKKNYDAPDELIEKIDKRQQRDSAKKVHHADSKRAENTPSLKIDCGCGDHCKRVDLDLFSDRAKMCQWCSELCHPECLDLCDKANIEEQTTPEYVCPGCKDKYETAKQLMDMSNGPLACDKPVQDNENAQNNNEVVEDNGGDDRDSEDDRPLPLEVPWGKHFGEGTYKKQFFDELRKGKDSYVTNKEKVSQSTREKAHNSKYILVCRCSVGTFVSFGTVIVVAEPSSIHFFSPRHVKIRDLLMQQCLISARAGLGKSYHRQANEALLPRHLSYDWMSTDSLIPINIYPILLSLKKSKE